MVNPNTVKISYRCLGNIKQKISAHNSKVRRQSQPQIPPGCYCTGQMGPCPLDGHCLVEPVVYGAEVVDSDPKSETYTGLTSNTFKKRFYKHRSSFQHEDQEHESILSKHIKLIFFIQQLIIMLYEWFCVEYCKNGFDWYWHSSLNPWERLRRL